MSTPPSLSWDFVWFELVQGLCVYILFSGPGAIIKLPDHT